jgi:glycosyltransferase involved in cell wall biosynthesis
MIKLSVVAPVYNESSVIDELIRRIKINVESITENFEIILIDDGSKDSTWSKVLVQAKLDERIKGLKFSRNFGHHYALTAGLHEAKGDWVVVMDGDLQDRPEVIPKLFEKAEEGFDIVFVSRKNRPEKLWYKLAQKSFYKLLRIASGIKFDSSQANYSILSRKVVQEFKKFPENARFYGTTILWLGFKRASIFADHGIRYSGKPSYTLKKRIKLAMDIIISFSERPLKFSIFLGILSSIISLIGFTIVFGKALLNRSFDVYQSTLILTMLFTTGIILMVSGIMSIYISRIFTEVKHRPLYIIDKEINTQSK